MPRAFSEQERVLIRERLMEQGKAQFSIYGLKKASVEELAKAAGISKAAFYLFFDSKETLFMDVVERVEEEYRKHILAELQRPPSTGESQRGRLTAALLKAFKLWRTIPLLQFFSRSDYELISRRIPIEKLQEHTASDRKFIEDLVSISRENGILIRRSVDEIAGMTYLIFLSLLHENDFGPGVLSASIEQLVELVAAFCLDEVKVTDIQVIQHRYLE